MATRTISTKLAIEGESEYRASLTRINGEIKTLQSSLKLTESEFQTNANSMAALTAKGEALNNLYEAQKSKVKELSAALQNAKSAEDQYAKQKAELTAKIDANNKALAEQDAKTIAAGKSWANQASIVASCEKELEALRKTSGDTSEAQAELEKKIGAAKEKMAALEEKTGGAAKSTGELLIENKDLSNQLEICDANLAATEKGINSWQTQLNNAKIRLNDLDAELKLNDEYLDEARNSADGCATSIDRFGNKVNEAADKADTLRDALTAAGVVAALKATADAMEACVDSSIEFESSMAGVAKTTDLTEAELADMADAIQDLSTRIPATTTEIAGVVEAAGQLGIAKDDLLSFSEVMVNLGVATNLSSTEAATALAKFANVVGMSSENYGRLGSVIVDLGNNFATTEADIVSMATRLSSTGAIIGLTEPQIMAIATALSSVGIEAEAGGSAISKLLKQFETMVATGSPKLEEFAAVAGMSADEFSQKWGADAVGALGLFIDGLGRIDDAGGSSVAVLDALGITEVRLSNAVQALASSHGILEKALSTADSAWASNTALANEAATRYETTESKLQMLSNACSNVKTAIGDKLTPAVGNLASAGTKVLSWTADMIEDSNILVPLITSVATVIGVLAGGLVAYTVVTKLAAAATGLFTAILDTNPIFLAVTAIAALVAGLGVLVATIGETTSEYDELSAASKQQYDELQELHAEYNRLCEAGAETSVEAQLLKERIDDETVAFEQNKRTAEQVASAHREIISAHDNLVNSYQETISGIETESEKTVNLSKKLKDLTDVENKTAGTKQEILAIVDLLNEAMPELGLAYDSYADSLNITTENLEALIEAEIERERHQADYQHLKDLVKEEASLLDTMTVAADEAAAAQQRLTDAQNALNEAQEEYKLVSYVDWQSYTSLMEPYIDAVARAQEEVDALTEAENAANTAYGENQESIESLRESLAAYSEETDSATAAQENLIYAQQEVQTQIESLAQSYKDAYDAAYESISGQIGLFDTFAAEVSENTNTVEKMMDRWAEQTENLASYTENLKKAAEYGLDDGLVASLSDGSTESAGYLATIIAKIEELGGTTEGMSGEADSFVTEFNAAFARTEEAKESFANTVAAIETNLDEAVQQLEQKAAEVDFSGFSDAMEAAFENVGVDFQTIGIEAGNGMAQGFADSSGSVSGAAGDMAQSAVDSAKDTLGEHSPSTVFREIGENADAGMEQGIKGKVSVVLDAVKSMGQQMTAQMQQSAKQAVDAFDLDFSQISARAASICASMVSSASSAASGLPGAMTNIGVQAINGMISGLNSKSSSLYSTISSIVNTAISKAKTAAAVHSPSRKTTEIFENVGEGMVVGLENKREKVSRTAQSVVEDALTLDIRMPEMPDINDALPSINTKSSDVPVKQETKVENHYHIGSMSVRDDRDIKLIASELYRLQKSNARGRGVTQV